MVIVKRNYSSILKDKKNLEYPDYKNDMRGFRGKVPYYGWKEGTDPNKIGDEYPKRRG